MPPEIVDDPAFQDFIEEDEDGYKFLVRKESVSEIEVRDPLPFEDDLLSTLVTSQNESFGASVPIKGKWIHGWLDSKDEDYINNIYRNWLHFTEYVAARTEQFMNTTQYNVREGSYKSMHRYIVMLEDLGLVERTELVDVPESEYDQFVPDGIRKRRFVEITTPISEAPEEWARPNAALYGEDGENEEGDGEQPTEGDSDTDTQTSGDEDVVASDSAAILEYNRLDDMRQQIRSNFFPFVEQIFENTDASLVEDAAPSDYALDQFIVYGIWVTEEATRREDELKALVSIDKSLADEPVGFLPASVAQLYQTFIRTEFSDWFTEFDVTGTYADRKFTKLDNIMLDQDVDNVDVRYDLLNDEIVVNE